MKKETRAEKYKRRYRAIVNAYKDPKLARKYRTYSEDRIYKEIGVKVTKRTPELKPLPTSTRQKNYYERKKRKVLYGISLGLNPKEAKKVSKYTKGKITTTFQDLKERKKPKTYYKTPNNIQERRKLWAEWTKNGRIIKDRATGKNIFKNNLPPYWNNIAIEINRNTKNKSGRLDDTDRYGYAIAYYMFIENESKENILERYKVDRYEGDLYREIIRKA